MRLWLALIGALVLVTLLIIDPVALARLGYACVTGGCGVRPSRLAAIAAVAVLVALVVRWRTTRAAPARRRASAKPRARAARKPRRAKP
jgi:hypothetical protein